MAEGNVTRHLIGAVALSLLSAVSGHAQPVKVVIDPNVKFQTMEGWGGHLYPQTLPYFSSDSSFEYRMLDELRTTHIRLRSIWYLLEAENDNGDPFEIDFARIAASDTGLVHDELVLQQRLHARGVKLLFASWRFPYWMVGKAPDWRPGPDEKPDLPLGFDDEYVESLLAYLIYARDRYGITFDAVSVANEPDIAIYIGGLTPARLLDIGLRLMDRLQDAGYDTRFYFPDVAAADSIGQAYTTRFFEPADSRGVSTSVAYHSYRREEEVIRFFGRLGQQLGLPVWVTEQSHTHLAVDDRFEWSHAMKNAVCLHDILSKSNASLSLYWSYAMSSSGGLGLYIPESKTWAPAYDMLKHFYNFVPRDSKRVEAVPIETDRGLRTVAFLRPDGSSIALIIIQEGLEPVRAEVNVADSGFALERVVTSTATYRLRDVPGNSVITLPPESITTIEIQLSQE